MPPGWDRWYALLGGKFFDYRLNENGRIVKYGSEAADYVTDVLRDKAVDFIARAARDRKPFFMYLAPKNPHEPYTPAPRHADTFPGVRAPRPPSFNEHDVSDKPAWVQAHPLLTTSQVVDIDFRYRRRLQMMLAVDEMIGQLYRMLAKTGQLDNTYIVFTSDNGYHLGQHRLRPTKGTAYEEDIRVPLIVRGPGVPAGKVLPHIALNIDLAPTFAQLGRVPAPSFVDGQSLKPLFQASPPATTAWRDDFLAETWAPMNPNTYAVRTMTHKYVKHGTGDYELYDLEKDPYELENIYATADRELLRTLEQRLAQLQTCKASTCRTLEK